jgi:hypothetical protein
VEVLRPPAATRQEPPDAAVESREERGDVGVGGRRQVVEAGSRTGRGARVDALEDQRVEVHVEVRGAAEPLNRGDRPAAGADQPPPSRAAPQPAEDGAQEDAQHGARQRRVERKLIAHGHRHGEDPLADRHVREDAIHEVGGERAHAPAAVGGTKCAPFAREPHDGGVSTPLTAHAQQAVGEDAAPEIRLELAPDERRPPVPSVPPVRARKVGRWAAMAR